MFFLPWIGRKKFELFHGIPPFDGDYPHLPQTYRHALIATVLLRAAALCRLLLPVLIIESLKNSPETSSMVLEDHTLSDLRPSHSHLPYGYWLPPLLLFLSAGDIGNEFLPFFSSHHGYCFRRCWHPHIHSNCPYGAVDGSGKFHKLEPLDTDFLTRTFADHVFDALLERGLVDEQTVQSMRAWEHSGFNVWLRP